MPLSDPGTAEYVEDVIRRSRIVLRAAEEGTGKSFAVDPPTGSSPAARRSRWAACS